MRFESVTIAAGEKALCKSRPLGAQWFYEGESLGYRTIYVWIADQDLMITVRIHPKAPTS
jgi:hypothetical protein